jgi:hypothetical protein
LLTYWNLKRFKIIFTGKCLNTIVCFRDVYTEDIVKASKLIPGVGSYEVDKKPKIKGCYK